MKILVINSGSSSIKFQMLNMDDESVIVKGVIDRIGLPTSILKVKIVNANLEIKESFKNDNEGITYLLKLLVDPKYKMIKNYAPSSSSSSI